MSYLVSLLVLIILILLVIVLTPVIREIRYKQTSSTPGNLTVKKIDHPFKFNDAENEELKTSLIDAIHFKNSLGEEMEKYNKASTFLKNNKEASSKLIINEIKLADSKAYLLR